MSGMPFDAVILNAAFIYLLLQFLKRQDLLNVLARMMRPACDQVVGVSVHAHSQVVFYLTRLLGSY